MFCNNGVSVHNVLRSFRSHRNLKSQRRIEHLQDGEQYQQYHQLYAPPVHHQRPVPNVAHHPRRPSEASSIETLNSDISYPRSSTSRRDEDVSIIEINPLRLHPPTEEDLFVHPPHTALRSPPRHHYERQHLGSSSSDSSNMSRKAIDIQNNHQTQRGGSLDVYDGFDFGFDNNRTPGPEPRGRTPAAGSGGCGGDGYFGIPVQPKSHWSRSPTPGTSEEEDHEEDDADQTPGPRDRTQPRPRGRPLEGVDTPEYFIKRGDWKRRGIVFTAVAAPMASQEETFDLDG